MQRITLALLLLTATLASQAQKLTLDAAHLLLDGTLTDEETSRSDYVYNNFREAASHLGDTATLYIKPYVYWVDNPDTPRVVTGRDGREPFGITIRARKLRLVGLSDDATHTVLASQRGQTQGAVGNFTMFNFIVDTLTVENLTMGNYCNVDLDYPLRPELSRSKRSETITQAHVGYVRGNQLTARNVRFISRLNLNPLTGSRQSYYEDCHFECTDDAMNGNAVYRHCTIDLYGSKPFWSTYGAGALLIDCDLTVKSQNREMYMMKQGGPMTLVDCRYHAPEGTRVDWTPYPQRWLRCYQQHFTLNGSPYVVGSRHPENTLQLTDLEADTLSTPPYVTISRHQATLLTGRDTLVLRSSAPRWRVQSGCDHLVTLSQQGDSLVIIPTNETDETAVFCVEAYTDTGWAAACELTVQPSILPPPSFLRKPRIHRNDQQLTLDYELDLQGRRDQSHITWLRDGIPVSVSHDAPQRTYQLTQADEGHTLTAAIEPRHQRSQPATPVTVQKHIKKAPHTRQLATDFHDFPCQWQPRLAEGYWTVDGYKPADTAEYPWTYSPDQPMWTYGEGFNGAVGRGLLQAQRGARLMYTPVPDCRGDMVLTLQVDPTKTAGQGFGSATGQYMDVCLKFDTRTLTGYGLRIIRTTKHAKAVDFLLVAYRNGQTIPLTAPVTSTCYRTGCTITLQAHSTQLTAHVTTTTPRPADSTLPHEVSLSATVAPTDASGIAIQHTGSCGESTTMLHRLQVEWLPQSK